MEVDSAVAVDVATYFTDPDGDTLTYSAVSSSAANATVSVTGSMVTVTGVAAGSAMVTVTARDSEGLTAEQAFGVMVPNRSPVVVGTIEDVDVYVDSVAEVDVAGYFMDPDGDELAYQAVLSDTTLAMVAVSGSMVTATGVAVGSVNVTVTAQDTAGLTAEQSFQVTVPNQAPVAVGTIADREVEVDSVAVLDVAKYFTDPDRQELEYSAAVSDTMRVAVAVADSEVTVAGVAKGNATVTVTATDPGGMTAEQSFVVTVPNRPPHAVGTIAEQDVYVGDTVAIEVVAHFSDPDGDTLAYTAASSDTAFAAVSVSGGTVTLIGLAVGSVTVTVTATDTEGLAAEQGFAATVPNRPPEAVGAVADQEVFVGDSVTVDVAANFAEPDGQELHYAVATSDPATVSVAAAGSAVTVRGVVVGGATVTVTAQDPGGLWAEQEFAVTVPNRAPETVGRLPDRELAVDSVLGFDIAAHFAEPDGEGLEYAATSSDTTHVLVEMAAGELTLRGVAAGQATVTIVATDPGGLTAEQSFGVRVPNRPPVTVGSIADRALPADRLVTVNIADYFADPDGDTLHYFAVSSDTTRARATVRDGVLILRGVARGIATIRVTASDPEGLTASQSFVVAIPNQAPRTVGTIADTTIARGRSASVDASAHFNDPDGDDLSYTATSSRTATATVTVSGARVTVRGRAVGTATITVTAEDPEGLQAVQSYHVTVRGRPNRAPRAVGTIPDGVLLVGEEYAVDLEPYFNDPDDDPLTYAASSSNNSVAEARVLDEGIFVTAAGHGSATVSVTATDPGGLSATASFEVGVVPGFDMVLGFTRAVTETQRRWFRGARNAWEAVLRRTELADVSISNPECWRLVIPEVVLVDDHLAIVHVDSIDGPGGTLAFAGYCYIRSSDGTPLVSLAVFDEDDIDQVMSLGMLGTVAFHEFAHGLGFTNRYWHSHGLLDTGDDPHFRGALAIEAFDAAGGAGYPGPKVPISSPDYSHWHEGVFKREGMTPALTLGAHNPFSAITLQAMADVGYLVDVSLADDYQLQYPGPPELAADQTGQVLDLSNDVVQGPIMVLGPDGRVLRVIPPPPGTPVPFFGRHEVQIERRRRDDARDGGRTLVPPAREPIWRLLRPSPRRPPR